MNQFLGEFSDAASKQYAYEDIFRVLIVEFVDAHGFDLRSIRKSCVHIVHPDGKRVIPFDTYNMLYRDNLEAEVLQPLRSRTAQPLNGPLSLARYGASENVPK